MFELSESELQVIEQLWKLIQSGSTAQMIPSHEVSTVALLALPEGFDNPVVDHSSEFRAKDNRDMIWIRASSTMTHVFFFDSCGYHKLFLDTIGSKLQYAENPDKGILSS